MNLWFSAHFLFAGLCVSISALTPEECQPLVTPLSLANHTMLYGRVNLIMGFADNEVYNDILEAIDSYWMNVSPSPFSTREVLMHQEEKIKGTCFGANINMTIDDNTATMSLINLTQSFHVLPSCDGCLALSTNSTMTNVNKFLQLMNITSNITDEEITTRALYLMARESSLRDSDLEHFKQQASCLGFTSEPHFHYDPKKDFCNEGEGVTLNLQ